MLSLGSDHRNPQNRKRYMLPITCLATRAVHLDYTVSESAKEFLGVLCDIWNADFDSFR